MTPDFQNQLRQIAASFDRLDAAFNLVAELPNHSDDLVADLIEALDDCDPTVQAAAAFSLGHLWYALWPVEIDASASIPKLLSLIDHHDSRVAFEATRAVAVLQVGGRQQLTDQQIVAAYLRCLDHGDSKLQAEIVDQLRAKGSAAIEALPALSRMLADIDDGVREAARTAIDDIRLSACSPN